MKMYRGLETFLKSIEISRSASETGLQKLPYSITLGKFESFHMGHETVLRMLLHTAKRKKSRSLVISFLPGKSNTSEADAAFQEPAGPRSRVFHNKNIEAIFQGFGLDELLYLDWEQTKQLSYKAFLHSLLNKIDIVSIVASDKLCFGAERKGTPERVSHFFAEKNREKRISKSQRKTELSFLPSVRLGNVLSAASLHRLQSHFHKEGENSKGDFFSKKKEQSSSFLRFLVSKGEVGLIYKLAYFPFSLIGRVNRGKQLGHKLGYPTANISYPKESCLLKPASYCSLSVYKNTIFPSMSYVGSPPSLNHLMQEEMKGLKKSGGQGEKASKLQKSANIPPDSRAFSKNKHEGASSYIIETHIFGVDEYLYNESLEVFFIEYLRENTEFKNQEALIQYLKKDEETVWEIFQARPMNTLGNVIDRIVDIRQLEKDEALSPKAAF